MQDEVGDDVLSDVVAVEENMRWDISSILSRVQGLEVHAQVNMAKLDQGLAGLEASSGKVAVGGLGRVCVTVHAGLQEVKQLAQVVGVFCFFVCFTVFQ